MALPVTAGWSGYGLLFRVALFNALRLRRFNAAPSAT